MQWWRVVVQPLRVVGTFSGATNTKPPLFGDANVDKSLLILSDKQKLSSFRSEDISQEWQKSHLDCQASFVVFNHCSVSPHFYKFWNIFWLKNCTWTTIHSEHKKREQILWGKNWDPSIVSFHPDFRYCSPTAWSLFALHILWIWNLKRRKCQNQIFQDFHIPSQ